MTTVLQGQGINSEMSFSLDKDNKSELLASKETPTRELPCLRALGSILSRIWNKHFPRKVPMPEAISIQAVVSVRFCLVRI